MSVEQHVTALGGGASLITGQKQLYSVFGETGSHFLEKIFSGFPSDLVQLAAN